MSGQLQRGALVRIHEIYTTDLASEGQPVFGVICDIAHSAQVIEQHGHEFIRLTGGNRQSDRWEEFMADWHNWWCYPHHCTTDFEPDDETLRAYGLYMSKGVV